MPGVELYLGDCLEIMPHLESVAAVITDPPYGIKDAPIKGQGRTGKRAGAVNTWHPESEWDAAINPAWCVAVCEKTELVAWMGHWRKRGEVEAAMTHPIRAEIVWAKDCHVGPPCPVAMQDERVWLFSPKGIKPKEFSTSVWSVPIIPTWSHKEHKNEKPVPLMARAIRLLTDAGETVLDPFMGSGSTIIAAIRSGRKAIGIEKDPEHFKNAVERIKRELAQGDLFLGQNAPVLARKPAPSDSDP
jgi:DNA modification methylase